MSARVPASIALLALHQEADRTGDEKYRISASTLRSWVHRDRISRGPGGYSISEICEYLDNRDRDDQRVA